MEARIHRINPSVTVPKYQSAEAAGFDLAAAEAVTVPPHGIAKIPTGLSIEAPEGTFLMLASRGSLAMKRGLTLANGVGIVDRDFSGPEDEIHIIVLNFTDHPVEVEAGERLAQGIFVKIVYANLTESDTLRSESRGGFGSTGGYKA